MIVAVHTLCVIASALAITQSNPTRGGSLTIGDGVRSHGTLDGTTEAVFELALTLVPDGGELKLLDGVWNFTKAVKITKSRISIVGSNASTLVPAATGSIGLFEVTGDGVRFSAVEVRATAPTPGQSAIKVLGDDFSLDHSTLLALGPGLDFRLVDLGYDTEPVIRAGALIEANAFRFGEDAAGVVGLRGRLGTGLRLIGNDFAPAPGHAFGRCRFACEFRAEGRGVISGNTFQNLGSELDYVQAVIYSDSDEEGHHFAISGNFFEYCLAQRGLWLRGGRFCSITGNVFGRMLASALGVVRLDSSSGGFFGQSNVIASNQMHNCGGPGVVAFGQEGIVVDGNQFTIVATRQIEFGASVFRSSITNNQFVKNLAATAVPEAIRLQGGSRHFVHGNTAYSEHPTIGFDAVVDSTGVFASEVNAGDNWKRP